MTEINPNKLATEVEAIDSQISEIDAALVQLRAKKAELER